MRRARLAWLVALALLLVAGRADAGGPRWVTGPPYFTGPAGVPVVWYTAQPQYFTDPGDLSAWVNHAAADALVAAAAGVWNVPTSAMVLAQGGSLGEHVSSANAYLSSNGPVFPNDVQAGNSAAKQVAVIYDSDGSVTDLLLGVGASAPAECRQNAVTESVDAITSAGLIQHALLVLNGRCTGAAPEQQTQMRYQLERAFGRVLGLGWSQTNDNVFTGTPQPTANQALHWPIMHPIDIVCGAYTYQCLPQPFILRDDDVAAISGLYPSGSFNNPKSAAPGKIWGWTQASWIFGQVTFPTGQGMQGVNVLLRRQQGGWSIPEAWNDVSSVSGYEFQQNGGNAVTGAAAGMAASMGSTDGSLEGYYNMAWVPDMDPNGAQNGGMFVIVSTEAINPLYTGAHAIGPFVAGGVAPSGASQSKFLNQYPSYGGSWEPGDFAPGDAASHCDTGGDGVESAPLAVTSGGWWSGVLCGHGHAAWSGFSVKAGRTATVEVTALDDAGFATTAKAMPLIGVWNTGDAIGTLPTVATTTTAFNTVSLGMTAVGVAAAQAEALRFVIADARGDGRPDFVYTARVLYADAVTPATSVNGGQITVNGMGFRAGNEVLVNGVAAVVSSWSATSIVAVAPVESTFRVAPVGPVDVAVVDLGTHATALMSGALTYGGVAPDAMAVVSSPSGAVAVGSVAAVPFAVRVTLADGVTPVVGVPVTISTIAGSVRFGACSAGTCVVPTDANGLATTTVMPMAFGAVTLQASAVGATQTVAFVAVGRSIAAVQPVEYIAAGAIVSWTAQVSVIENGAPAAGAVVQWGTMVGMTIASGSSVADTNGMSQMVVVAGPLAAGAQASGQACAWVTVCAEFAGGGVDPAAWRVAVVSGAGQTVQSQAAFAPVVVMVTDGSGNPVVGTGVVIHQTVDAAERACPARGRCPVAPLLGAATMAGVSDPNGMVSVMPMQMAGVGEVTNVAVAAGTQGFVSLSVAQTP
jgi:hypothetical protein